MSSAHPGDINVSYQWADYQRDACTALEGGDVDLVVLRSGYGAGKSITGAQWIHRGGCLDARGAGASLVLAQDYQKGKSTTFSVFFERLPGDDTNPFADGDPENSPLVETWHSNDHRLTYVTGHTVYLGGADQWSRFAGAEFCRIWCDEVGHYPPQTDLYKLHEMLVTRQRTEVGPNTTLWTSTGNGFNPFYDITERQVDKSGDPLRWANRMRVIEASTEDNPFLPEGALEKIRAQFVNTDRAEQGLHGGFAAAEGLVYSQFSRQTHVITDDRSAALIDEAATPIYGYDAGWDHPRVLVEFQPTHYDQWVATDLYYETGKEFEHLCDPNTGSGWVYDHDKPRGTVYCEHEPEHIQKFRRAGFDAVRADKSLDEGIPYVRGRLSTDDSGRPGLLVHEDCTEFIQEFQSYKEDHVGGSGDVPDHCPDVARYALYTHDQRGGSTSVRRTGSMSDLL